MDTPGKRRKSGRITIREFASQTGLDDFDEDELTNVDKKRALGSESHPDEPTLDDPHGQVGTPPPEPMFPSGIEVVLVQEHGVSQRPGQWRAFEVWTSKRVYAVDGSMVCFGVMDRATGQPDPKHAFLGARLMGGEKREEGGMRLTHPLPTPGTEAVFQIKSATKGRYGHTSTVEKVVARIRVTVARIDDPDTMWEDITTSFRKPT
jgi:hypothetical protein